MSTYPRAAKVLDIGCSSGTFGEVLIQRKQCVVDGVELDKGDFEQAKKRLRNVYQLNVETDDLSDIDEKYDFIYFGDVIEHLVHPSESLARVRSLLKPNGKIVFSIPNMSHISVRLMLLRGELQYGQTGLLDVTHLHFYTYEEVQRVFANAGFEISKLDPVVIDYPRELLDQELERVGLTVTQKFIDFAAKTEASVYQFVGTAEPLNGRSKKNRQLEIVSPVDKFQVYLNKTKEHYEAIIDADKKHIAKQEMALRDSNAQIAKLESQLEKSLKNRISRLVGGNRK